MKILVLNSTYRPGGTTAELTGSFMEGARADGADVEEVMLRDRTIGYCTNCLKCYAFPDAGIAPCSQKDDMDDLVLRIEDADGVLFASPVHNGFVTGLMTVFWERLSWRVARMGKPVANFNSLQSRIDAKVRAFGSIASAGGMPERLRKYCDDGTPWLRSNAPILLHGQWVGDIYAGADLQRMPRSDQDWQRIYFLRQLSTEQKQRARELGAKMVQAIRSGSLKPVTMENMFHPALRWVLERYSRIWPFYRIAG